MTGGELSCAAPPGTRRAPPCGADCSSLAGPPGTGTGLGMIAGTVVVFGAVGRGRGALVQARVARGPRAGSRRPPTYRTPAPSSRSTCACCSPRLRDGYGLPVRPRHLNGLYRRYSGDMAELGKGEILAWTAK